MSLPPDNRPMMTLFHGWELQSAQDYAERKTQLSREISTNIGKIRSKMRASDPTRTPLYDITKLDTDAVSMGIKKQDTALRFCASEGFDILIPRSEAVDGIDWSVLCFFPYSMLFTDITIQRHTPTSSEKKEFRIQGDLLLKNGQTSLVKISDYEDAKRLTRAIVTSL